MRQHGPQGIQIGNNYSYTVAPSVKDSLLEYEFEKLESYLEKCKPNEKENKELKEAIKRAERFYEQNKK